VRVLLLVREHFDKFVAAQLDQSIQQIGVQGAAGVLENGASSGALESPRQSHFGRPQQAMQSSDRLSLLARRGRGQVPA